MGSPRVTVLGMGEYEVRLSPPEGIPAKRMDKLRKGSETSGSSKGLRPLPWHRVFAHRSRSYKWPEYEMWTINVGKRKTAAG